MTRLERYPAEIKDKYGNSFSLEKISDAGLKKIVVDIANSCPESCYIWETGYMEEIWYDRGLVRNPEPTERYNSAIGVVLEGCLQITEVLTKAVNKYQTTKKPGIPKTVDREAVTAILRPGAFFGLFESLADLRGNWTIRSGLSNILITGSSIGDSDLFSDQELFECFENSLKHNTLATYDYKQLIQHCIDKGKLTKEKTTILLFDFCAIEDKGLIAMIYNEAIMQLSSFIKENPYNTFINYHLDGISGIDIRSVFLLHSIMSGYIPVFRLLDKNNRMYCALEKIFTEKQTEAKKNEFRIHVFESAYVSNDGSISVYFENLSKDTFDLQKLSTSLRICHEHSHRRKLKLPISVSHYKAIRENGVATSFKALVTYKNGTMGIWGTWQAVEHDKDGKPKRIKFVIPDPLQEAMKLNGKYKYNDDNDAGAKPDTQENINNDNNDLLVNDQSVGEETKNDCPHHESNKQKDKARPYTWHDPLKSMIIFFNESDYHKY
jgi:hypothetical protein